MNVSDKGLLELAEHEGIVPGPYKDSVGIWTWGIGHTRGAGKPDPIVMDRGMPNDVNTEILKCVQQFKIDIEKYETDVNKAIRITLHPHQFDALVSFHYNTGGIFRARLTKQINAGNPEAYKHFMGWIRPPEIRSRRKAEMDLFLTGDYSKNGDKIPVFKVDGKGRLRGLLKTISGLEMLNLMNVLEGQNEIDTKVSEAKPEQPEVKNGKGMISKEKSFWRRAFGISYGKRK